MRCLSCDCCAHAAILSRCCRKNAFKKDLTWTAGLNYIILSFSVDLSKGVPVYIYHADIIKAWTLSYSLLNSDANTDPKWTCSIFTQPLISSSGPTGLNWAAQGSWAQINLRVHTNVEKTAACQTKTGAASCMVQTDGNECKCSSKTLHHWVKEVCERFITAAVSRYFCGFSK